MGDAPWGGSEVLWSKTAELALQQGHAVFMSTYRRPAVQPQLVALQEKGAILFRRPPYRADVVSRIIVRLKLLAKTKSEEVKALEAFAPDLVIFNQGGAYDVVHRTDLVPLVLRKQFPYGIICHLYQDPVKLRDEERVLITRIFSQAQRLFAISATQAAVMQRQLATRLPNLEVVQNPVNLPDTWPVAYPTHLTVPQLAVVASLDTDRKGQDVLLEVLGRPHWRKRPWHLNLYGKGPDNAYLERLAAYYGITDRVTLRGHVAGSEQIWAENHVAIVSSRIESGPMVLTEAMLSGRPVVATNVGIVTEWVREGENGFIAEASLPDSLDAALERCWAHQNEWEQLGRAACAYAKSRTDFNAAETMLEKLLTLTD